jgi:hypothetical protein
VGRLRSPAFLALLAVACVVLPAAAVGGPLGSFSPGSAAAAAANSATFNDSTGEDAAAPDITTIVVSNNDAGILSFKVNVPNRPTLGSDMLFEVWVDSDNNVQTGSVELGGADYVMQLVQNEINLFKWDGTDFTRRFGDPSAVTLTYSYAAGITVRISTSELGNTKQLKFFVVAVSGIVIDPVTGELDGTNSKTDVAPGGGAGLYPYEVKLTAATLLVRKFSASPAKPAAGKTFSLRLQAARSDTGALLRGGRVTCAGRVGKAALRTAQPGRFVGAQAVCTWVVPATAKGKTFRGTVTIVFEGRKVTRSFSGRIG